jgi:hypothetical protein
MIIMLLENVLFITAIKNPSFYAVSAPHDEAEFRFLQSSLVLLFLALFVDFAFANFNANTA